MENYSAPFYIAARSEGTFQFMASLGRSTLSLTSSWGWTAGPVSAYHVYISEGPRTQPTDWPPLKKCPACGSVAQETDDNCGVCGKSFLDIGSGETHENRAGTQVSARPKRWKLRLAALLFPPVVLVSGILVMAFWGRMFPIGLSLVIVALIVALLMIGIGPSGKAGYGWYLRQLERDYEEERAEEESD